MRLTITLLFLLSTSIAYGQITVGGSYSKEEIAKAKAAEASARAIINAADGVKLQLQVDQFECVHPKKDAPSTSPLLWITNDETIVERIEIEAGTPLIFRGVRAGDTAKKTHYFSAQPFRWAVLIGSKEGGAKLVAVQNGAANQAPAIYGEVNVTVGKGPKPPDPPDPDPDPTPDPDVDKNLAAILKPLLIADKKSWANTKDIPKIANWIECFHSTGKMLELSKADSAIRPKTLADLYAKHKRAWEANEVPTMPFLAQTRLKLDEIIDQTLGNDPAKVISDSELEKASKMYLRFYSALKEANK